MVREKTCLSTGEAAHSWAAAATGNSHPREGTGVVA
jgi:hypothetical protein